MTGFPLDLGAINGTVTLADDFGAAVAGTVVDKIDLGSVPAPVLGAIATQIHNAIVGGYTTFNSPLTKSVFRGRLVRRR